MEFSGGRRGAKRRAGRRLERLVGPRTRQVQMTTPDATTYLERYVNHTPTDAAASINAGILVAAHGPPISQSLFSNRETPRLPCISQDEFVAVSYTHQPQPSKINSGQVRFQIVRDLVLLPCSSGTPIDDSTVGRHPRVSSSEMPRHKERPQ